MVIGMKHLVFHPGRMNLVCHHVSFHESMITKHRHPPPRAREGHPCQGREREGERVGDREDDLERDREEEGVAEVRVREDDT
jgi:hypothetical protein